LALQFTRQSICRRPCMRFKMPSRRSRSSMASAMERGSLSGSASGFSPWNLSATHWVRLFFSILADLYDVVIVHAREFPFVFFGPADRIFLRGEKHAIQGGREFHRALFLRFFDRNDFRLGGVFFV